MPRAPRDKENATPTPKKRTRKTTAAANGNGVHAENGNGAVETVTAAPKTIAQPKQVVSSSNHTAQAVPSTAHVAQAVSSNHHSAQVVTSLEEQIRLRAYHLYLRRGGHGGSPEQDWLQAVEEISREHSVA
jgi:hypothetical protein